MDSITDKLKANRVEQEDVKMQIRVLESHLEQLELEEKLLKLANKAPIIVPATADLSKYRFISEPVQLPELNIIIFPVWLQLECTYPRWSKDFVSLNIVRYDDNIMGKGYEVLIEGLKSALNMPYSKIQEMIKRFNLKIPGTYTYNYVLDSNLKINYHQSSPISYEDHMKNKYYLSCTDDQEMVMNTVWLKYILVLSMDKHKSFYFSERDHCELI